MGLTFFIYELVAAGRAAVAIVTVAAVDRLVATRDERYSSDLTARGASCLVHFAWSAIAKSAAAAAAAASGVTTAAASAAVSASFA